MEDLIILGAGTMAQEVTELAEDQGRYNVIGYAVNVGWTDVLMLNGLPVFNMTQLSKQAKDIKVVRAIFQPCLDLCREVERMGFQFGTVIHPSAAISKTATIEPGVVINRLVAIGYQAVIGRHSLINRGCTIGHHTKLGEAITMGPGANIAGNCTVGNKVIVGMGANIRPGVTVGEGTLVRMGAVVVKDIPDKAVVIDNPAR